MKIQRIIRLSILSTLIMLLNPSCQKVIIIDLNSADPKVVVEGKISNVDSIATVKLNYTVNFDQTNSFPPVRGAQVVITDSKGNSYNLYETHYENLSDTQSTLVTFPGIYTTKLTGVVGETYHLNIKVGDENYTAESTLNPPVAIDTLKVMFEPFHQPDASGMFINCYYVDPAITGNNYRFVQIINSNQDNYIWVDNDKLQNNVPNSFSLFNSNKGFTKGDTVTIKMQMIDISAYEYLSSLANLTQEGGGNSTPTNPKTNMIGGALGYFSAYSEVSKEIIIK